MLQYGDKISLTIDNWDTINRIFTVIACKVRENSTAVELILEDVVGEKIFKCVVARSQIIKEEDLEMDRM